MRPAHGWPILHAKTGFKCVAYIFFKKTSKFAIMRNLQTIFVLYHSSVSYEIMRIEPPLSTEEREKKEKNQDLFV